MECTCKLCEHQPESGRVRDAVEKLFGIEIEISPIACSAAAAKRRISEIIASTPPKLDCASCRILVTIVFASEESTISDFSPEDDDLLALAAYLGVPVAESDYVWEVAKRLREK